MRLQSISALSHRQLVFILIAIGYVTLMFGNGIVALTDPDEVFYSQTAVEMVKHNSWFVPYLFDQPQFEKPILCYTLMAVVTKIFGATPFVERFWPSFFGILGLVVTYWISWLLFNNKRTAFLSGLILGTSFIYIALSRAVLTDMVFSIIVTIAIGFFYYAYTIEKRRARGIILFFVFSGIAVLAKGLLGFVFPVATAVLFLISQRNLKFLWSRATLIGLFLFAAIALPWHVVMIKQFGHTFIDEYFYNVHIRRLFEAEHQKSNTWYFYPLTMIGGTFPWVCFLVPAIFELLKQIWRRQTFRKEILFLFAWIIGVFIFVQPAQSKLSSYVFPVFPALAIFIAYFVEQNLEGPSLQGKLMRGGGYVLAAFLFLAGIVALIISPRYIDYLVNLPLIYGAAVALIIYSLLIGFYLWRNLLARVIAVISFLPLILITLLVFARPYAEPWVACREIGGTLKKIDSSSSVVLASKFYVRGVRFFTQRDVAVININGKGFFSPHPIPFLNTDQKVRDFLASQPRTFCVLRSNDVADMQRIIKGTNYRMHHWADKGGRFIVSVEQVPGRKRIQ